MGREDDIISSYSEPEIANSHWFKTNGAKTFLYLRMVLKMTTNVQAKRLLDEVCRKDLGEFGPGPQRPSTNSEIQTY